MEPCLKCRFRLLQQCVSLVLSYHKCHCPSIFSFTKPSVSPCCCFSSQSGLGISTPVTVLPYVIPPSRLMGRSIAGSMRFLSSLIASSRTQNLTPSMIANTPVFFPFVARLSNSLVSINLPSMANMLSLTRLQATEVHLAGVNPDKAHSEIP